MRKIYVAKTDFAEYDVYLDVSEYVENKNVAVSLWSDEVGPVAMLTKNLEKVEDGYAYIDTNNNPWAEDFIVSNGLGEPTGKVKQSGYCIYPLYKLNMDAILE